LTTKLAVDVLVICSLVIIAGIVGGTYLLTIQSIPTVIAATLYALTVGIILTQYILYRSVTRLSSEELDAIVSQIESCLKAKTATGVVEEEKIQATA